MYFGMIGGFLFILIQLILIVDFAHSLAETWVGNYEETESKGWYCALISVTFFNYALTITGVTLLFVFFTKVSPENYRHSLANANPSRFTVRRLRLEQILHLHQSDTLRGRQRHLDFTGGAGEVAEIRTLAVLHRIALRGLSDVVYGFQSAG